jgi:hypothetical protein
MTAFSPKSLFTMMLYKGSVPDCRNEQVKYPQIRYSSRIHLLFNSVCSVTCIICRSHERRRKGGVRGQRRIDRASKLAIGGCGQDGRCVRSTRMRSAGDEGETLRNPIEGGSTCCKFQIKMISYDVQSR